MTEQTTAPSVQQPLKASDPRAQAADNLFKTTMRELAASLGLQLDETEFQHKTTRADLVITVPEEKNLAGTMFDFFRGKNVIEFKSENDNFGVSEFASNTARTDLLFTLSGAEDFSKILTVFIVSRYPQKLLAKARKRRIIFRKRKEQPWLLEAVYGFQDIAILVCRDLPLEYRYFSLLLFAPSTQETWQTFMEFCVLEGYLDLARQGAALRPEAFTMVEKAIEKKAAQGSPEAEAKKRKHKEAEQDATLRVERLYKFVQEIITADRFLAKFSPEQRLAGLKPEERLVGLKPEERLVGLKPEERLVGLKPEEQDELLEKLLQEKAKREKFLQS